MTSKPITTLFCVISAGYHFELHVAITFHHNYFYQVSYIIFFGVHTNYLFYLGKI